MKKIVRSNTFETNSSSTHSLTIINKKFESGELPISSSYTCTLEGQEFPWGEYSYQYITELGKARFMLNIIATHIEDKYMWKNVLNKTYEDTNFEEFIKENPFVWFKEVLEEETGTEFEFVKPENAKYFPYYSGICLEDDLDGIIEIDWYNEEKFKERVKQIVFNKNIVIVNSNIEYGSDVDFSCV